MKENITHKILKEHLAEGRLVKGEEIGIVIDQTLTQDATGTMAFLQFEALGLSRVKTELSVSYVDHNTLQSGFENADDHLYLQTAAARFGAWFSRPGNGICHQVHLERFGVPGKTLLGADSHTPTAGGIGMLAIGAGGLDVAVAMGGGPFYLTMPAVLKVHLVGSLPPWVGAKDIILEILRRLTVKGAVGKIIEYAGPGVAALTVPERATIANMGAELGATSSVFPSDEMTLKYMESQQRGELWRPLTADEGALYDEELTINLGELEPLVALPHSPDRVQGLAGLENIKVDQVAVGSCTNSSYQDLYLFAELLKGKVVHPAVSLVVAPGSRQVLLSLARDGVLESLVTSGARILETACGPCIGMGQAPPSGGVSVRTFNRNFAGRSGTKDASIYLAGPAVAAAAALTGHLSDPAKIGPWPAAFKIPAPVIDDAMLIPPADALKETKIIRGPNIKKVPLNTSLPEKLELQVLLHLSDHITTDHIMPGGAQVLPLRSNIERLSQYAFYGLDENFAKRAKQAKSSVIVAAENYGQGSSREHAALVPMYLGVKAVLAKSFARIHRANLINFGILPLVFCEAKDYDRLAAGDMLVIKDLHAQLNSEVLMVIKGAPEAEEKIKAKHDLSPRELSVIKAGGLLNYTRQG